MRENRLFVDWKTIVGAAVLALLPLAGQATVVAQEGFDYTAGALAGKNGGTGFGSAWTSSGTFAANVGASGLSYPANTSTLAVSGGALVESGNGVQQGDYSRSFDSGLVLGDEAGASTVWMSWLINASSGRKNLNSFVYLSGSSGNVVGAGWAGGGAAGANPGSGTYRAFQYIGTGGTTASTFPAVVLGETHWVVMKVDFSGDSGADTVRLFMDPGSSMPADGAAFSTLSGVNLGDLTRLGVHWGASATVDEITVATSYASLAAPPVPPASPVPEPATTSLLLAGLGLVGFVASRRRPAC